jgi:hypothetical protein
MEAIHGTRTGDFHVISPPGEVRLFVSAAIYPVSRHIRLGSRQNSAGFIDRKLTLGATASLVANDHRNASAVVAGGRDG